MTDSTADGGVGAAPPFSLLMRLFGDAAMSALWSEQRSIQLWSDVEAALAQAQADLGILPSSAAGDITAAAAVAQARLGEDLWKHAANVGYPILPVVRAIDAATLGAGSGRVHLGATTQDIMDTALAIQMRDATDLLIERATAVGDLLAGLVEEHAGTLMAGRTHAQQAVPITFGLKAAVFLDQVARSMSRLRQERREVARVSLFGAAGTSAALGPSSVELRARVAARLGLEDADVPWHVSRDAVFVQAANAVALSQVVCRLAREVVDLSRTEVQEVSEAVGTHRGASSTMPQKSNPILSEAIIGFSGSAASLLPALARAMETGHERAAGEWQIEWQLLPQLYTYVSSALSRAGDLLEGLRVDQAAMLRNLDADSGLLMAESYMMVLSSELGRETAHDVVYAACVDSRDRAMPLLDTLRQRLTEQQWSLVEAVTPAGYLGESGLVCERAIRSWAELREEMEGSK